MSKIELLAKIELLNKYEAMVEEMKVQADTIRNEIKAEMEARAASPTRCPWCWRTVGCTEFWAFSF